MNYSFDIDYDSPYSPLLQVPAILLTQVCSRWRIIANEVPSIWASIKIRLDETPLGVNIPLQIYLSRSEGYPLDLRIEGGSDSEDGTDSEGETDSSSSSSRGLNLDVWTLLSKHLCRSQKLTMTLESNGYLNELAPIENLSFPVLESFREESEIPDEHIWPWFSQAIQEAPKLTTLSTIYPPFNSEIIPFPQITDWEVQSFGVSYDVSSLLNILKSCSSLISLTLTRLDGDDEFSVAVQDVHLFSLRRLEICGTKNASDNWLSTILHSLFAPDLETCYIQLDRPLPLGLFIMAQGSSPSLSKLSLTLQSGWCRDPLQISRLFDLLQITSGLTQLELFVDHAPHTRGYFDNMISALLCKLAEEVDDPRRFLREIDTLYLSFQFPLITLNAQLMEQVLETVTARQSTSCALMDFRLVRDYAGYGGLVCEGFRIEPDVLQKLEMLEEIEGIKVIVEDRYGGTGTVVEY
ncbi:hypothetical protein L218DRAFT_999131 [Marasmius fiardii PR-910]|nr:hypothetical protein L218DRAFT_999131 [Marasmius fiardii PR-910]